ncbi:MAG: HEPN domain-containing protein [Elusimicrobiota bacterium]|jgi:uncharacterized protein (UPF0332 family)|nr:HEPN domain-containing protein [Elusimicrobiota bacterium]
MPNQNINILKEKSDENFAVANNAIVKKQYNSAISRIYYSVFQIIKFYIMEDNVFFNKLDDNDKKFYHSGLHALTYGYLRYKKVKITQTEMQFLSKIAKMKEFRELADYNERWRCNKDKANEYMEYAKAIRDFIEKTA